MKRYLYKLNKFIIFTLELQTLHQGLQQLLGQWKAGVDDQSMLYTSEISYRI